MGEALGGVVFRKFRRNEFPRTARAFLDLGGLSGLGRLAGTLTTDGQSEVERALALKPIKLPRSDAQRGQVSGVSLPCRFGDGAEGFPGIGRGRRHVLGVVSILTLHLLDSRVDGLAGPLYL